MLPSEPLPPELVDDEEAVRRSFRLIGDNLPGILCVFRLDADGHSSLPMASDGVDELYGIPASQLSRDATPIFRNILPTEVRVVTDSIAESALSLLPWHAVFRYRHPRKGLRWIEGWSTPTAYPDGSVAWRGFVMDVTAQQMAEVGRRDSEARYRDLVENLEDVVYSIDPGGCFTFVSRAVRRFGWQPEELVGRGLSWLVHPDDGDAIGRLVTGEATRGVDLRILDRAGNARHARISGHPVHEGRCVLEITGVIVDLTRQRETEEQFRAAQKMEAIGRLAGGIAHDFNNLLTVISSCAEMVSDEIGDGASVVRGDIDEIRAAAARAAQLTQQLLAFSRRQAPKPCVLDLDALIAGLEKMLRRLIGEDVEMVFRPGAALDRVRADPGQLSQVLLNLVINARDAMPEGGRLIIETRGEDESVLLAVTDTGSGIDPATRARIFEPFFTTKPVGKGTGLGLSTVHDIVEQLGGTIAVHSQVGRGTTFEIRLPRQASSEEREEEPSRTAPRARPGETVLVVEDEPVVRGLLRRVLAGAGYQVLVAADGDEAVEAYRQRAGRIDLLLTDVVLPAWSGRELAARLSAMSPSLRVLFVSGYGEDHVAQQGVLDTDVEFLGKPFTAEALARKVRAILDRAP